MATGNIDWVVITGHGNKDIGAVGFIGNDAVSVIAFYDDRDGNKDGKVSWGEAAASFLSPISIEGSAVTEVAMQARLESRVVMRDPSFLQMSAAMFANFARGLVIDGVYAAYFARGVGSVGGGVAKMITKGMVKEFVVRKGFEKAVKEAFNAATDR